MTLRLFIMLNLFALLATFAVACAGAEPSLTPATTPTPTPSAAQEFVWQMFGPFVSQELPSELDLPLPPGTEVIGTLFYGLDICSPGFGHAILDVPLNPEETIAFFEEALTERGWETQKASDYRPGLSTPELQFRKPEDGTGLNLEAAQLQEGLTDVRVFWYTEGPFHPGLLPALGLPSGVEPGGGDTGCSRGSELSYPYTYEMQSVQADLKAKALEDLLGSQLDKAGWRLQRREAAGPAAWSTWSLKDDGGDRWNGWLMAVEMPGARARRILLGADQTHKERGKLMASPTPVPASVDTLGEWLVRFHSPVGATGDQRAQVLPGALPPNFDLRLPPGSRVVGSVKPTDNDVGFSEELTIAIFETPMDPKDVEEFFLKEPGQGGWKSLELPKLKISPQSQERVYRSFCNEPEAGVISLMARPFNGGSSVRLTLSRGDSGSCDPHFPQPDMLIPDLTAPSGSEPLFGGGGAQGGSSPRNGSFKSEHTFAFLRINLGPEAIEEHFRSQLEEAGWKLNEMASDRSAAWSIWGLKSPGGQEVVGLLLVLEMWGSKAKFIMISMEQPG